MDKSLKRIAAHGFPWAAFSYRLGRGGLVKRHRKQINRRIFNFMIIFAALLYSGWLCFSGIHSSVLQQVREHLMMQIQDAAFSVLEEQEMYPFVSLQRDANHNIVAVSVNGIALSQLQMKYQTMLKAAPSYCNLELRLSDLLGTGLFSWIPGGIQTSCKVKVNWDASIVSRTIEVNKQVIHFQLILITNGTATCFSFLQPNIREELVLYETMICTSGT